MNKVVFGCLVILTTGLMGSAFTIGKIGLDYSSPLLLTACRFTLAGIIMAVVVGLLKKPHPTSMREWLWILLIGSFQTAVEMVYNPRKFVYISRDLPCELESKG